MSTDAAGREDTRLARLGGRRTGAVYLGRSPGGRAVAVEVIRPECADARDFRRRAGPAAALAQALESIHAVGLEHTGLIPSDVLLGPG